MKIAYYGFLFAIALFSIYSIVTTLIELHGMRQIRKLRAKAIDEVSTTYVKVARNFVLQELQTDYPSFEYVRCGCSSLTCPVCLGSGVMPRREVFVLDKHWKRDVHVMEFVNNSYH